MTVGVLGGIILILGSFFVYRGDIFKSVGVYFLADLCWVYLSYINHDIFGTISITIGMLLGLGAFIKMNMGIFNKTLIKH